MYFQKNAISLFVAAASFPIHAVHAKPYSLRGANSDTSIEGKRNLSEDERSYVLVDERKKFGEAREYCKSLGMDLASITSAEENRMVAELCKSASNGSLCWIGLAPQWLDGSEYIYQGNNESYLQDAVVISGKKRSWVDYGGWRYSKGRKERAFICSGEIIPEITSSTTTTTTTTMTTKPSTATTTMAATSSTTTDSVEATEFICPTGWTPYGNNKKCLKVVNQGKSFSGHESNCQSIAPKGWSGSLVSFHSQDDLDVAGAVCRTILDYSDGCSGGYACRTGLHFDGTVASFTDGSAVDYLTLSKPNMWDEGKEQCAQLADGNDESLNCNNLRTFADGGGSCDSSYHKNKGLCQIWPDTISSAATTTTSTRTTTTEPTTLATTTSTTATTTTTTKPTTTTTTPTTTTKSTTTEKTFPTINTVASVDDLVCPQGQTFVDLGYSCALNKQTFQLVVTSPGKLGIPKRSGCSPGNGVAGGGKGGCSYCDEDNTQNTERTLIWWMSGDCPAKAPLSGTFAPKLEDLILSEDGIDLCSLDYERNDGGDYITSDLGGKFEGFLQTIFCRDIPPAYSLIDQKKSFSEARAYCQSYGSDLASITSAEENAEVASLCESATNDVLCWIGLSDEAAEGSPQWLDGSEYEFENWNSASGGNPNASQHESRDVVTISGIQSNWMDYGAWEYTCGQREESLKRVFICGGDVPDVP
mmetsp:Transcript_8532/g.15616  ORF Transcript_8532/g.15616 Transcript_8532/m.15616 type:complete len:702 (-) Transcript_8532:163-2268(-)